MTESEFERAVGRAKEHEHCVVDGDDVHCYAGDIEWMCRYAQALLHSNDEIGKLKARTCSHGEYKVWGTDQCGSCMGGRVTLYYLGDGVCFECEHRSLKSNQSKAPEGGG
jgi:hypothetical protein